MFHIDRQYRSLIPDPSQASGPPFGARLCRIRRQTEADAKPREDAPTWERKLFPQRHGHCGDPWGPEPVSVLFGNNKSNITLC